MSSEHRKNSTMKICRALIITEAGLPRQPLRSGYFVSCYVLDIHYLCSSEYLSRDFEVRGW